ncbi:MAG: hypothetical protein WC242_03925 [Candidatus Paceibacterota bacterium]|jgi:dTMP kinase
MKNNFFNKLYFFLTRKRKSKISGKIIVFEGIDGSGKETQFKLFIELLRKLRVPFKTFDFPQYQKTIGGKILRFVLDGKFCNPSDIPIKLFSFFYALDRKTVANEIRKASRQNYVVALNRYTTSNKGHQTWKFKTLEEQEEYLAWLEKLEHDDLGIPQEDIVVFFDLNIENALMLINKRQRGTDKVETDVDYLTNSLEMYRKLAQKYSHWITIKCEGENGVLLLPETIHKKTVDTIIERLK